MNPIESSLSLWSSINFWALIIAAIAGAVTIAAGKIQNSLNDKLQLALKEQIVSTKKNAEDASERAAVAIKEAANLGVTFSNLHDFVTQKESEADAQLLAFKAFAEKEKERNEAVIIDLKRGKSGLDKARSEAITAAEESKKILANMTTVLEAERAVQGGMRELVTPRVLSDDQIELITNELKKYPNTPFDLTVTDDPDTSSLSSKIIAILINSGWDWKPPPKLRNGVVMSFVGHPNAAVMAMEGFQIVVAKSKVKDFEKPVLAFTNGLINAGIKAGCSATADDQMRTEFDINVVHILIGRR